MHKVVFAGPQSKTYPRLTQRVRKGLEEDDKLTWLLQRTQPSQLFASPPETSQGGIGQDSCPVPSGSPGPCPGALPCSSGSGGQVRPGELGSRSTTIRLASCLSERRAREPSNLRCSSHRVSLALPRCCRLALTSWAASGFLGRWLLRWNQVVGQLNRGDVEGKAHRANAPSRSYLPGQLLRRGPPGRTATLAFAISRRSPRRTSGSTRRAPRLDHSQETGSRSA